MLNASFSLPDIDINAKFRDTSVPIYDDTTTITPSKAQQTISCAGYVMTKNIVVDAIPSNYGKITYSGYVLRVE